MAEAPASLRVVPRFSASSIDVPKFPSELLPEPVAEARASTLPPSQQIVYWVSDRLEDLGVQPRSAMSAGRGTGDVLGLTPVGLGMAAGDATHAASRGDYLGASLAALPLLPLPFARPLSRKVQPVAREALFDLGNLEVVPNVPQFALARYQAPKGVPERTSDLLNNSSARDGLMEVIEAGKAAGALGLLNTAPLREPWLRELGPQGDHALRKFLDYVAATSNKSDIVANLRNASLFYHLDMSGKRFPLIGERNPFPWGHIAQRLHQANAHRVASGNGFDPIRNPKPASLSENLSGNYLPVQVDSNTFRLSAMAAGDDRFLKTRYQPGRDGPIRNIQEEVRQGKLSMNDALLRPSYWTETPRRSEYGPTEQLWSQLAMDAGMAPAQAQSAGYLVGADMAGSKSAHYSSIPYALQEVIHDTANKARMEPRDALRWLVRGDLPLYSGVGIGGAAALLPGIEREGQVP